jgi:E3 SUMO-protein ligase PIAS1
MHHSPKYQLRLYCTTSQYFITLGTSFRNTLCPVEFPPTCEVRINSRVLQANFRGIKKKAGTAPPADITELCNRAVPGVGNAVEMIYVNSNQATGNKVRLHRLICWPTERFEQKPPPQKFYLVINLVEVTAVHELVERLRRRMQPKDHVIASSKYTLRMPIIFSLTPYPHSQITTSRRRRGPSWTNQTVITRSSGCWFRFFIRNSPSLCS